MTERVADLILCIIMTYNVILNLILMQHVGLKLVRGNRGCGCRCRSDVLFLHDVSDIAIDLLKLTNYLKLEVCFIIRLPSWPYFTTSLWATGTAPRVFVEERKRPCPCS